IDMSLAVEQGLALGMKSVTEGREARQKKGNLVSLGADVDIRFRARLEKFEFVSLLSHPHVLKALNAVQKELLELTSHTDDTHGIPVYCPFAISPPPELPTEAAQFK
ncbi:hypothetical protein KIPB_016852, partial [Kipferlia bialata]